MATRQRRTRVRAAQPAAAATFERRPYDDDSPWNQTLAELYSDTGLYPTGIPIHADSDLLIESIKTDTEGTVPYNDSGLADHTALTSDPSQFTMAVYVVDDRTPFSTVAPDSTWRYGDDDTINGSFAVGEIVSVRVPANVYPAAPDGGDSQVVIIDLSTGYEWNFFACLQNADGTWYKNPVTGHYECSNAGRYEALLTGTAVPGTSPKSWTLRGAGVPYLTGLVRPFEIRNGVIQHALAIAYDYPNSDYFYPATKSDGVGKRIGDVAPGVKYDPPEGARLRLKSSVNPASYTDPVARIVGRALQDYGAIIIDNSGRPKLYFEYQASAGWGTGGLPTITSSTVSEILIDDLEVIDWDPATPAPDILQTLEFGSTGDLDGDPITHTSPSWTPQANELLLVGVTFRRLNGSDATEVTGITGNGLTWSRVTRLTDTQGAITQEIWQASGASPSSGAVAVTLDNDRTASAQALRITAGAAINDFAQATTPDGTDPATVDVTTTVADCLVIGFASCRNNTFTKGSQFKDNEVNTSNGAGGDVIRISTEYRDLHVAGTLAVSGTLAATNWIMGAVAVEP